MFLRRLVWIFVIMLTMTFAAYGCSKGGGSRRDGGQAEEEPYPYEKWDDPAITWDDGVTTWGP